MSIVHIVLLILPVVGAAPKSMSTELSLKMVSERVINRQAALHKLVVDAYMTTNIGKQTQTDRFLDAYAPQRGFVDFMHLTDPDTPPWHDNERFQIWLTPDSSAMFKPFTRVWFPDGEKSFEDYWFSVYIQALGWHPEAKTFEKAKDEPFYLDHLLSVTHRAQFILRKKREKVDSYDCVVLESTSKSDLLWLAPDLNFALVKRVLVRGEKHDFKKTFHCRDFREMEKGMWLPWIVESESFDIVGGVDKPLSSFRIDVQKLAVNNAVPDALFHFKPPPGTLTYDSKKNVIGFEPGGEDLLDFWGTVCVDVFPPTTANNVSVWQIVLTVLTCAVGLVIVLFVLSSIFRT